MRRSKKITRKIITENVVRKEKKNKTNPTWIDDFQLPEFGTATAPSVPGLYYALEHGARSLSHFSRANKNQRKPTRKPTTPNRRVDNDENEGRATTVANAKTGSCARRRPPRPRVCRRFIPSPRIMRFSERRRPRGGRTRRHEGRWAGWRNAWRAARGRRFRRYYGDVIADGNPRLGRRPYNTHVYIRRVPVGAGSFVFRKSNSNAKRISCCRDRIKVERVSTPFRSARSLDADELIGNFCFLPTAYNNVFTSGSVVVSARNV